jgi:hypothetical protein
MQMSKIELLNQLLEYTIWKQIDGYENYEVSICGSVRNITTKRILRPNLSSGYYYVILCRKNEKVKNITVHSLVANAFIPKLDTSKNCVDHIDSNRLNNTISNLRWASHQENQFNRSLSSKNTSSVKGVSFDKKINMWRARIMINNKRIHLGYFDKLNDAKIVRQQKAAELFGEFINSCEL